ncbi:MAG TPA: hypothetical protein VG650_16340 [Mycobacteriales bacterium]|nr:hypothetical protein [Mycobacteriales bacterium]
MRTLLRRRLAAAAGAIVLTSSSGCATSLHGLEFHNDKRLKITFPHENELVTTPFTLRWTMRDFTVAEPGKGPVNDSTGYFAIFVDRSPIKPGRTLAAINQSSPSCERSTLCTTKAYLAREQVYTTTANQLTLHSVADILSNKLSTQFHTATVVLLNTAGERFSESAWTIEFRMHSSGVND